MMGQYSSKPFDSREKKYFFIREIVWEEKLFFRI